MCLVNNFCCCCDLESGGIILGWVGIIASVLFIIIILVTFFGLLLLESVSYVKFQITPLIILILYTFVNYLLVKGTTERKHKHLLPALVSNVTFPIIVIVHNIRKDTLEGYLFALILAPFSFYFFICLYSLYVKLRDELPCEKPIQYVEMRQIYLQAIPMQYTQSLPQSMGLNLGNYDSQMLTQKSLSTQSNQLQDTEMQSKESEKIEIENQLESNDSK